MPEPPAAHDVFIGYSNRDEPVAQAVCAVDARGRRSRPVSFSFEVRKAVSADRSIMPRGFKLKLPH